MAMTERENFIRSVRMTGPDWMPCRVTVSDAGWLHLGRELDEIVGRHPWLFPDFRRGERSAADHDPGRGKRAGERLTDNWNCEWRSEVAGVWGQCVGHPLSDWEALPELRIPDPYTEDDYGERDWDQTRKELEERRRLGRPTAGTISAWSDNRSLAWNSSPAG